MKYLKKFESFSKDGVDVDHQSYPEINPALNKMAKDYVDNAFRNGLNSDVNVICKEMNVKMPKTDEDLDKVKELALKYFSKNPERMKDSAAVKSYPTKSNTIPKLNNIGGSLN